LHLAARLLFVVAAMLVLPTHVLAQGAKPEVTAVASARAVEVGEPFTIELKALSEQGDTTSDPQLRAPAGFTVSGPRISTQTMAQFGGGKNTVKSGLGATWTLVASTPGSFVIPAPSVSWNGQRLPAGPIPIEVTAATGTKPPASPFLLPGGPNLPWPFGSPPAPGKSVGDQLDDSDVPDERELALDTAADDKIFLRIAVDKKAAVVGEQVTASFFVYYRVDFEMNERHEAPLADFVRVQLVKNPGTEPPQYATAGGHRYAVRLLDKVALFPVRAGAVHTGKMTARFTGRKLGSRVMRESNDAVVEVTEPPKGARPPGYEPGNVGKFALGAAVQPKRIDQGQAVGVTVKVTGSGNLPQRLRVPERTGIEWLDPEVRQSIETPAGVVGGWRTFGYVVRVKESGTVDLGKIELPFWDPAAKKYEVAVAELGTIEVEPVAPSAQAPSASANAPGARDPFASLSGPRRTLGAWKGAHPPAVSGLALWLLIAGPPALFGLSLLVTRARDVARKRHDRRTHSAEALSSRALRQAHQAQARGDAKAVATEVERAVHAAIESATGLKSRAILLADLPRELEEAGVPPAAAGAARDCLAACDALRFDPGASAADLGDLCARGRSVVDAVAKRKAVRAS
jgi:hypothetical protein